MKKQLLFIALTGTLLLSACENKTTEVIETTPEETIEELNINIGKDSNGSLNGNNSEGISNEKANSNNDTSKAMNIEESVAQQIENDYTISEEETQAYSVYNDNEYIDSVALSIGEKTNSAELETILGISSTDYDHIIYCTGDNSIEVGIIKINDEAKRESVKQALINYIGTKSIANETFMSKGSVDSKESLVFFFIKGVNIEREALEDEDGHEDIESYNPEELDEEIKYTMELIGSSFE